MIAAWILLSLALTAWRPVRSEKALLKTLKDKHLIIASVDLQPYMYLIRDEHGNITGDGIIHQMLLWMAERFEFTFHYVEPPDGKFGAFVNGTWSGMVGMTMRKEVDLIAAQLTTTHARSQVIDFTMSFSRDPMSAIIPAPSQGTYSSAVIAPFTGEVWILILSSMIGGALATCIVMNVVYKYMPENYDASPSNLQFSTNFFYFFGIIASQAGSQLPNVGPLAHAVRLPAAIWGLTCVIFLNLFVARLTSFIAAPQLRPLVSSFDELANSTDLQLAILKYSTFETIILEAHSGAYKALGDSLRKNPQNRLPNEYLDAPVFLERALKGKLAMVDQISYLETVLDLAYKTSGTCMITMMKDEVVTSLDSLAVQKGSPYLPQVDYGITTMAAFALLDYWERRYLTKPKCALMKTFEERAKTPRLTLEQLIGPFLLLLAGMGISSVVFIIENRATFRKKLMVSSTKRVVERTVD